MSFEMHYKRMLVERYGEDILRALWQLKDRLGNLSLALYGDDTAKCFAVAEVCHELGLPVACICDAGAQGGEYLGLPIVPPDAMQGRFSGCVVAVCREDADASDLAHKGLTLIPPEYSKLLVTFSTRPPVRVFKEKCLDGYAWAYDFFEDEISKQTVVDRLRLHLCGKLMQVNTASACYFEDGCIALGENEVFVDAGAHIGDTALGFILRMKSRNLAYARIYAFEPDADVYPDAARNLAGCPNVTLSPKGLWSQDAELDLFAKSDTGSSSLIFLPDGAPTTKVPVTYLDSLFADAPDSALPTFIKMDIEGAEKEALLGARGVIKRNKPKLAICAYHKPEDVFDLPQTILTMRDDYRFALRQHEEGLYDTVLYAV